MKSTLFAISCAAILMMCCIQNGGASIAAGMGSTPPLCEPGIIEELPPHIRKVCVALENSNQLSNALNAYIRNEAAALLRGDEMMLPGGSGTGKRTDVDHVFLRFGRK